MKDLAIVNTPLVINRDNFDFAVIIYVDSNYADIHDNLYDPNAKIEQYFSLFMNQMDITLPVGSNNASYTMTNTPIPLRKCGLNAFKNTPQSEIRSIL